MNARSAIMLAALPAGSTVRLEFAINGPTVAAGMTAGSIHIGYLGDVPAVTLAAGAARDFMHP